MLKKGISAVCIAVLGMAVPPAVSAQSKAPEPTSVRRPYRGIFGGPSDPAAPQSLVFAGSVYGAYDDNILAGLTDRRTRDPFLQRSGPYEGVEAGLDYSFEKIGDRFSAGAVSGAMARYTRSNSSTSTTPYAHADLHMSWRVTRSTTIDSRASGSYSPRYNFGLMPLADEATGHDIAVLGNPDFDLFGLPVLRSTSSVFFTQQLWGKNTSLSAGYIYRTVDVTDDTEPDGRFHDYRTQTGLLRVSHSKRLTPHAELQLGYGVRVSDRRSGTGEPRMMQNINAGVNYSRALSFSRRTSLSFSSGYSILTSDRLDDASSDQRPRFRLIGDASLVHEMGRTWTAQLAYARAVRARDGFGELYFTDAVTGALDGLITRRLSWTTSARWSISSLDRSGRNGYRGASASSQATYALNSVLGLFARYVYYQYRYDEGIPLDPRLPRQLDRQGVRVGFTTSVPLIR